MKTKTLHDDKYLVRDSFFNLVELSLLAKMYEQYCLPVASAQTLNSDSVAQTLLKMKATENNGELRVAIYDAEPVGFYWKYKDQVMGQWIRPEHRLEGLEQTLSGPL